MSIPDERRRRGRPGRPTAGAQAAEVQSLARGLALLETLAGADGRGLPLSAIAERTNLPPSTVHRLLTTLERRGFAALDVERGRWSVGVQAFTVGNAFLSSRDYVAIARPFMRHLMEQSGESVNLGILDEASVVFLAQVQCREMMRMTVPLGGRSPLHASGVGKALLAALPEFDVVALVGQGTLRRYTDHTIDAPAILRENLAAVRQRGYALDDEEHAVGLRCVAATLHDEHAEPIAAISLSGPHARIADARIPVLGRLVVETATAITHAIGGRLPPWRARAEQRWADAPAEGAAVASDARRRTDEAPIGGR